ncbi:helix-turn-helix transcriptional regulator [uncultured Sphingomonas sp.]|uniref:helix-turn-helix transcriptional regulator n=1 Tax=uncultured Sphingomonas sp. TaxID=158754 RepID=UPI0030D74A1B
MILEKFPVGDDSLAARCAKLNERQRVYLRHVLRHRKTKEIAHLENVSERIVDKQLRLAKDILGANNRFQAAVWFAEFEAGVESSYPANSLPSQTFLQPLLLPVPTRSVPDNWLVWRPVLIWGVIISLVVPLGLSIAAMLLLVLMFLCGGNLQ